ncbi:efflux RND transporter periplasmic adaptor subunit [Nitrosophilus kaiyonis]|uniref:efflux RND transporter periplasmic adaptor subunit n=1 Tax=Nitrosophilus kaiyonis TaxID=2930200 RepID=UPI002492701D|nr:efflux RND transporter periplasmic adaptor subunit [Nitrosophilus kaiyonis]
MKKIFLFILIFASSIFAAGMKLSGTVMSDDTKMIASRFMGFVKKVYVDEGDYVKKGQLLYTIDSKEIDLAKSQVELAISQARLAVQMNQNMYNNVHLNYERYKRLYKKGMVAKYELENMELMEKNTKDMVEIAKKQLSQAKAKLKEVLHQYEYLKLRAPNDAVVIQKNIKEGQIAIPGMPALIITSLDNLKVLVEISESNLNNISLGKSVDVYIPSINFKTKGKIASIIPASNPMTHKFKVKIKFDKKGNKKIIPGMYSEIIIK